MSKYFVCMILIQMFKIVKDTPLTLTMRMLEKRKEKKERKRLRWMSLFVPMPVWRIMWLSEVLRERNLLNVSTKFFLNMRTRRTLMIF